MSIKTVTAAALGAMLTLTGCTFIPPYQQPPLPVAQTWPGEPPRSAGKAPADSALETMASEMAWRDFFQSDPLQALIQRALEHNRDLRVAVLNIEKAKALYRIQKADSLPTVSGTGSVNRQRVAKDLSASGQAYTTEWITSAGLGVTAYELDFFGRVRSLNQEALETFLATDEAARSARITLIAQTADAYLNLLANRKLHGLAEATWKAQKETYGVIKQQYEVGSASRLDLARAATSVESARVSMAQFTRQAAQAQNALTLLVGTAIKDLLDCGESIDDIRFLEHLPAGLPSEVLLSRPDIRAAEHRLKAANADIGAARAALYPRISLTGSLGVASTSLTSLFDVSDTLTWGFTPSLTIPVFNRDGLKASLAAARVSEKIAATEYEEALQTAFREVADQLAARKTYTDQLAAQKALVQASREAYTLSKARYENGVDDFLAVLDSQRSLFAAQQGAITTRQAYLSNLINLYKVLGGGQSDA